MNYVFNFNAVWANWHYLVSGIGITVLVTLSALGIGLIIGIIVGVLRLSKRPYLSRIAWLYIEVLRNTPALVQLIWVYYCLPILTGLELQTTISCIIALSLQSGAYIGEIVRGGIAGIDRGQSEAARTLGLSSWQTMTRIILPQALRRMLAPLVNQAVTLLKYSSLVSILGVADLTYNAQVLATTTFRPLEIFTFLAHEYLAICSALSYLASRLEKRLAVAD